MNALEKAARAKELLEDPIFLEAFNGVRNGLVSQLESCPFADKDLQHEITITLQLLKRIKGSLERFVADGSVEQKALAQKDWIERARQRLVRV